MFNKWLVTGILCAGLVNPVWAESNHLKRVDDRYLGKDASLDLTLTLTNKQGQVRTRTGKILRLIEGEGRSRFIRQINMFLSPAKVKHTGILWEDRAGAAQDSMWLYLPGFKKIRRISASERGDNFVGTDFSYEDIKVGLSYDDYTTSKHEKRPLAGFGQVDYLEVALKTDDLKRSLGYDHAHFYIASQGPVLVRQDFFNKSKQLIKQNMATDLQQIDGIWTPMTISSHNLETGHKTVMKFTKVQYNTGLTVDFFSKNTLMMEKIN